MKVIFSKKDKLIIEKIKVISIISIMLFIFFIVILFGDLS